jgi:hypothetical protein
MSQLCKVKGARIRDVVTYLLDRLTDTAKMRYRPHFRMPRVLTCETVATLKSLVAT